MKRDSGESLPVGEIGSLMQKRSNDRTNKVTKNIRSSENNGDKSSINIKGSMSARDKNKSLDERSDNSVNFTNKEISGNGQINQKGVKNKIHVTVDSMSKRIKGWNLSNKLNKNYNGYVRISQRQRPEV